MRPLIIVAIVVAAACFISSILMLPGCAKYQPPGQDVWRALNG